MAPQEDNDVEIGINSLHDWSHGLINCEDTNMWLLMVCCPLCYIWHVLGRLAPFEFPCCVADSRLASVLGLIIFVFFSPVFGLFIIFVAIGIQEKFGITEHHIVTFLKSCCCTPCYMMQMYHETLLREPKEDVLEERRKKREEERRQDEAEEAALRGLDPEDDRIKRITSKATFVLEDADYDEVDKKVRNHEFAKWLKEDRFHEINCGTLPLTFGTYLIFIVVLWCHGNIDDTFRMQQCLKGAIHEVKAYHAVSGIGQTVNAVVNLTSINSVDEMWSWVEGGLVPLMAGTPQKPRFVRTFNQVIGQIQLRQERFKTGECQVGDDLAKFYRQGCHSATELNDAAFGSLNISQLASGTARSNASLQDITIADAFRPGHGLSGVSDFNQKRFLSWLDIRRPVEGQAIANRLRKENWIDSGTKSLEVLAVFYNAEIQAYGHIRVKLNLKRGGLIDTSLEVKTLWATMYTEPYMIIADVIWGLFLLKFIANSIQQGVDNKQHTGCRCKHRCCRCCCCPSVRRWCTLPPKSGGGWWLAVDWLGIFIALTIFSFLLVFSTGTGNLGNKVGELGLGPLVKPGNHMNQTATSISSEWGDFHTSLTDIIEDIEYLLDIKMIWRLLQFWYSMVFLMRWFKGFRGQARIAQITSTLSNALSDLIHFAIIFAVLFVNFTLAGHVLFGPELEEWSTVTKALQSSMGMAWGKVDFKPMYDIAPYSAFIWLFGYVITLVMICMNMLLAIIADHYGDVFHENNAGDKGHNMFSQSYAMLYEMWWNYSFVGRWLWRILYDMLPQRVQGFKFTPKLEPEDSRTEIPYEELHWICEMDPCGHISVPMLRKAGLDKATARHVLTKCEDEVLRHLPENYPLEFLFDEFDESMQQYYYAMDTFSENLRFWFDKQTRSAGRLVPRQEKLDEISKEIELAQIIEHKHHHHHSASTLEGEGAHHHHHRRHHNDAASAQGSNSQSHSQSQSRTQSQQPSRVSSRHDL